MSLRYTGEKRAVEISIEGWEAHANFIIEWTNGVELEQNMNRMSDKWFPINKPTFNPSYIYRIAQRKPQAGEVWVAPGNTPWLRVGDETDFNGWVTLEGNDADSDTGIGSLTYAAPSVKAYYAREMLAKLPEEMLSDEMGYKTLDMLREAADLRAKP